MDGRARLLWRGWFWGWIGLGGMLLDAVGAVVGVMPTKRRSAVHDFFEAFDFADQLNLSS